MLSMYQNLLFLLCGTGIASALPSAYNVQNNDTRIIGGAIAPLGTFPFQVALYYTTTGSLKCGGVIYDALRIITAAHCVQGISVGEVKVAAGATRIDQIEESHQYRNIADFVFHPSYENLGFYAKHDIAVILLDQPLQLNPFVLPLALNPNLQPIHGEYCRVSGWGLTENGFNSPFLRYIDLPMINDAECDRQMKLHNPAFIYHPSFICQSSGNGIGGGCNGDSGGPLVCHNTQFGYYLAGIVNSGVVPCGQFPTLFANIQYLSSWLNAVLN